jgi:hypothetical protein
MGAAGPLRRVLNEANLPGLLETLSERLPGADLTTLLLEVTRRRAANVSPATLMSRYDEDRFVAPGGVSFERLRRAEDSLLDALPAHYEAVTLAPVVPLGTHSALGTVDQNKIVSTVRGSEVAADPTNGLALEAARRRRAIKRHHPHSAERVNLASIQRVLRAQRMEGTATFSHFGHVRFGDGGPRHWPPCVRTGRGGRAHPLHRRCVDVGRSDPGPRRAHRLLRGQRGRLG